MKGDALRKAIEEFFKGAAIKAALSFIGSKVAWMVTGPWGWIANLVLTKLWNAWGRGAVNWATRKGLLFYDTQQGKIQYKKIEKAIQSGNDDDYWDAMS